MRILISKFIVMNHKKNFLFLALFTVVWHSHLFAGQLIEISKSELKLKYGLEKDFVEAVELPSLIALSSFPELKNTKIKFVYNQIATTMAARPEGRCLFKKERIYIITINQSDQNQSGFNFVDLPLEAKIGVLAHEFAHISKYEKLNKLELFFCALQFKFSTKYQRKMERATDQSVITHGLGKPLFAFTNFIINESNATETYKEFKKAYYLSPQEIIQLTPTEN